MNGESAHGVPVGAEPATAVDEDVFVHAPRRGGWIADLVARLRARPPAPRRVVVGRAAPSPTLPTGDASFFDVAQLDGQLADHVRRATPDEIFFDLGAGLDEPTMARLGADLLMDGTAVHFVIPQLRRPPVHAEVRWVGGNAIFSLRAVSDGRIARVARRVLDVAGAGLLLVLLAPLFTLIATLVWGEMGRPILHVQERLGRGGRRFRLLKFRSMVPDAEAALHAGGDAYARYRAFNFKLPAEADDRVTPLGRFLRKTSLDELPQLWNVLRGDMSLVGPRPIVPDELVEYGAYGRLLLRVKPGLTGLWQVSGRSAIGYPERAHLDLGYVEGRTLMQDVRILLSTVPAVIRQRGSL